MNMKSKKIKIALLLLMFFCFFLPFVTVSCQNQEVATLNGFKLVTGGTVGSSDEGEDVPVNPFVLLSFIAIIGAAVYVGFSAEINNIILIIINSIIMLLLIAFKITFTDGLNQQGFDVSYKAGYWLLLFLSLGSVIFYGYLHMNKDKFQEEVDDESVDDESDELQNATTDDVQ